MSPSPLSLVTIHHEGAADPTDIPRGSEGGYTYWLGKTKWLRLRSPYQSWATLNFNHVSVDVCASGNRMVDSFTDNDIVLMQQIAADTKARGELTARPTVRQHHFSPGSNTVCPGENVVDRWAQIVACFEGAQPVPNPKPAATPRPELHAGAWGPPVQQLQHELNVCCGYHLKEDGLYGPQTTFAVHAFQAFFHLQVDGIAGRQTWGLLDYIYGTKGGK